MPLTEIETSDAVKIVTGLFNANPSLPDRDLLTEIGNLGSSSLNGADGAIEFSDDPGEEPVTQTTCENEAIKITGFGAIEYLAPDAGLFEIDIAIQYTDGPTSQSVTDTVNFDSDIQSEPIQGQNDVGPGLSGIGGSSEQNKSGNNGVPVVKDTLPAIYDGFPNGRRPENDLSEIPEDTFVFHTNTGLSVQDVLPVAVQNASGAAPDPSGFNEFDPEGLSGATHTHGPENSIALAVYDDLIL